MANERPAVGIYDPGSNVSLVGSGFLSNDLNVNNVMSGRNILKGVAGLANTVGLVTLKIKIGDLEEYFQFFIVRDGTIDCEFLLGLDFIKKFKLCQNEN